MRNTESHLNPPDDPRDGQAEHDEGLFEQAAKKLNAGDYVDPRTPDTPEYAYFSDYLIEWAQQMFFAALEIGRAEGMRKP
jgi:hypothetical protein